MMALPHAGPRPPFAPEGFRTDDDFKAVLPPARTISGDAETVLRLGRLRKARTLSSQQRHTADKSSPRRSETQNPTSSAPEGRDGPSRLPRRGYGGLPPHLRPTSPQLRFAAAVPPPSQSSSGAETTQLLPRAASAPIAGTVLPSEAEDAWVARLESLLFSSSRSGEGGGRDPEPSAQASVRAESEEMEGVLVRPRRHQKLSEPRPTGTCTPFITSNPAIPKILLMVAPTARRER
eukprot:SAG11_NODE_1213_length_5506_cov_2.953579_8_plen_235_part_00